MSDPMLAVLPIRDGVLPLGSQEAVAEAGGAALLVGSGCPAAAEALAGVAGSLWSLDLGSYAPARWAVSIAAVVAGIQDGRTGHLVLPASPDGRDLGPRLAAALGREYVAAATRISAETAEVTRFGGRVSQTLALQAPVVASFQVGVRGVAPTGDAAPVPVELASPSADIAAAGDPELLEELPADPSTMDLAEADRIVGGGAGLGSPEAFEQLRELAALLGASPGGTRVVTYWGWLPVERQIGTTGITVDPSLYLALGISGAVQHTAGLGSPDHIISVNSDPHCPMMGMADLAVVCDGPAFLGHLLDQLGRLKQVGQPQ